MRERENQELTQFTETVFRTLREVPAESLQTALQKAKVDPAVGLAVSSLGMKPLEFEDLVYQASVAKIISQTASGERPCITPHYHKRGYDFVIFLKPTELNLGKLTADGKAVDWSEPSIVNEGDELRLDEGQVHSWRAVEGSESDFLFYCPDEHLVDNSTERPDGDRYVVKQLENGIPSHYKK